MEIQPATSDDFRPIRALLEPCGLPHDDLTPSHLEQFFVARDEAGVVGTVSLEPCGTTALLRSLAVVPEPEHRDEGVGGRLVDAAEAAGGTYADIEMTEAVTDGNLVTAPVWSAHAAWIREFLEVLDPH